MGGLAKDYTKGGQYIQIKVGDSKPAFYALASAPAPDKPVEIIVKNQGDTAEILCDSKAGAECVRLDLTVLAFLEQSLWEPSVSSDCIWGLADEP